MALHELPHEIGDFAFLVKKGYSLGKILGTQILTSMGALFGGILGTISFFFVLLVILRFLVACSVSRTQELYLTPVKTYPHI